MRPDLIFQKKVENLDFFGMKFYDLIACQAEPALSPRLGLEPRLLVQVPHLQGLLDFHQTAFS